MTLSPLIRVGRYQQSPSANIVFVYGFPRASGRADDFKIPPAAMKEEGESISLAIKFTYVGEDINRDALHRDRAFIVVDTTRSDPARFGLVIFNESKDGKVLPDPHWVYREKDLSRTVMFWASSELLLLEYHENGKSDVCRVRWNRSRQEYSCK